MNTNEKNELVRQSVARLHEELNVLCLLLTDSTTELPKAEEAKESVKKIQQGINLLADSDNGSIEITVTEMLQELGIPSHLKGYQYLRSAILESYNDPELLEGVVKCLYPKIAKLYNTTPSRAERAIRHAIEVGSDNTTTEIMEKYFGYSYSTRAGKPTNSNFVASLVDYIKLHQ